MRNQWSSQIPGSGPGNIVYVITISLLILFQNGFAESSRQNNSERNEEGLVKGRKILMVVGDSNETTEPGKCIGDIFVGNYLEKKMGHIVKWGVDNAPADELRRAATKADLVIVAESTTSIKLLDKLKHIETPIINFEAFIQDDLGMTAKEPSGDPGEPDDFAYGVKDNETSISIVNPSHPLAAGVTGTVAVYQESRQVTWGKVAESAVVIATLPGDKRGASIYVYGKGAKLFDGSKAAGMRIGFFLEDDNERGTPNIMTEEGFRLFDAAVKYALDND